MRMQKEELVTSTLTKATAGPRRKYYPITPKGENELKKSKNQWDYLQNNVNQVLASEIEKHS